MASPLTQAFQLRTPDQLALARQKGASLPVRPTGSRPQVRSQLTASPHEARPTGMPGHAPMLRNMPPPAHPMVKRPKQLPVGLDDLPDDWRFGHGMPMQEIAKSEVVGGGGLTGIPMQRQSPDTNPYFNPREAMRSIYNIKYEDDSGRIVPGPAVAGAGQVRPSNRIASEAVSPVEGYRPGANDVSTPTALTESAAANRLAGRLARQGLGLNIPTAQQQAEQDRIGRTFQGMNDQMDSLASGPGTETGGMTVPEGRLARSLGSSRGLSPAAQREKRINQAMGVGQNQRERRSVVGTPMQGHTEGGPMPGYENPDREPGTPNYAHELGGRGTAARLAANPEFDAYQQRRQSRRDTARQILQESSGLRAQQQLEPMSGTVPGAAGRPIGFAQPRFGRGMGLAQAASVAKERIRDRNLSPEERAMNRALTYGNTEQIFDHLNKQGALKLGRRQMRQEGDLEGRRIDVDEAIAANDLTLGESSNANELAGIQSKEKVGMGANEAAMLAAKGSAAKDRATAELATAEANPEFRDQRYARELGMQHPEMLSDPIIREQAGLPEQNNAVPYPQDVGSGIDAETGRVTDRYVASTVQSLAESGLPPEQIMKELEDRKIDRGRVQEFMRNAPGTFGKIQQGLRYLLTLPGNHEAERQQLESENAPYNMLNETYGLGQDRVNPTIPGVPWPTLDPSYKPKMKDWAPGGLLGAKDNKKPYSPYAWSSNLR